MAFAAGKGQANPAHPSRAVEVSVSATVLIENPCLWVPKTSSGLLEEKTHLQTHRKSSPRYEHPSSSSTSGGIRCRVKQRIPGHR